MGWLPDSLGYSKDHGIAMSATFDDAVIRRLDHLALVSPAASIHVRWKRNDTYRVIDMASGYKNIAYTFDGKEE